MSDLSVDLERVMPDSITHPEINESKVARIRAAWKRGDYKPDSKEIAGHLVEWLKSSG